MPSSSWFILSNAVTILHKQEFTETAIASTLAIEIVTVRRYLTQICSVTATSTIEERIPLTHEQQCTIIAFYCQSSPLPGMQRWTLRTAARHINNNLELLGRTVHHSTIGRLLASHHLRPHTVSYFLHIRDPLFFEKMHHILGIYELNSDYLFCFDECPNIQAVSREGPDIPQKNGGRQLEFVYQRNGTTDLFGFLRVSKGTIDTYCRPSHETKTLIEVFTSHVKSQPENEKLYYICDNLSPHFNIAFCDAVAQLSGISLPPAKEMASAEQRRQWLQKDDKRISIHFTPFHGSWLNQVEVWFGLLKRYTLDGGWFGSVDQLIEKIETFTDTWNEQLAHPFNFQYKGKGLEGMVLRRFTRILKQNPEKLLQSDSKFIADVALLCVQLITQHKHAVPPQDWRLLAETVTARQEILQEIIENEKGPIRKIRAQKAFKALLEEIAA